MATPRDQSIARIRGLAVPALALLGLCSLLGACASGTSASGSQHVSTAAVRATCSQVSAVLSDGPDPSADPVGYAEAQILPLSQIRTSDSQLRAAISKLAGAYRAFFASNGTSGSAKLAVAAASKRIDAICPGAAS
jgi:hypothetical protein